MIDKTERPITLDECAEFLGMSKWTIYRKTSDKRMPHHKEGKRLYFYKSELNEWIRKD